MASNLVAMASNLACQLVVFGSALALWGEDTQWHIWVGLQHTRHTPEGAMAVALVCSTLGRRPKEDLL